MPNAAGAAGGGPHIARGSSGRLCGPIAGYKQVTSLYTMIVLTRAVNPDSHGFRREKVKEYYAWKLSMIVGSGSPKTEYGSTALV